MHLNLSECFISTYGAALLFGAAACHQHLKTLDLSRNVIGSGAIDSLASMLKTTTSLGELYLSHNRLSELEEEQVVRVLASNGSIIGGRIACLSSTSIRLERSILIRNASMHETVHVATEMVLAIHRFRPNMLGKDCGVLLGRSLFQTTTDFAGWEEMNERPRRKKPRIVETMVDQKHFI